MGIVVYFLSMVSYMIAFLMPYLNLGDSAFISNFGMMIVTIIAMFVLLQIYSNMRKDNYIEAWYDRYIVFFIGMLYVFSLFIVNGLQMDNAVVLFSDEFWTFLMLVALVAPFWLAFPFMLSWSGLVKQK